MLEGARQIADALAAGLAVEQVLVTPAAADSPAFRDLLPRLESGGAEIDLVAPDVLDALADTDSPRGLLAAAVRARSGVEALPRPDGGRSAVYVFLDGLQDPGNLGALARTAEAAGVAGLALAPGTVDPHHPRAVRGAAGSLFRLPVAVGVSPEALDAHLDTGSTAPVWLALAAHDGDDLYDSALSGSAPLVLALGSEGPGLSAAVTARADRLVTIPLAPGVESLNATVAAALVLFELRRRRETR